MRGQRRNSGLIQAIGMSAVVFALAIPASMSTADAQTRQIAVEPANSKFKRIAPAKSPRPEKTEKKDGDAKFFVEVPKSGRTGTETPKGDESKVAVAPATSKTEAETVTLAKTTTTEEAKTEEKVEKVEEPKKKKKVVKKYRKKHYGYGYGRYHDGPPAYYGGYHRERRHYRNRSYSGYSGRSYGGYSGCR